MGVYVVRLQDDGDAERRLVGIYVAGAVDELAGQVAQSTPTRACEYARVPHGCLYTPDVQQLYDQDEAPASDGQGDVWDALFAVGSPLCWSGFAAARPELQAA
jgi:hypothetical protein